MIKLPTCDTHTQLENLEGKILPVASQQTLGQAVPLLEKSHFNLLCVVLSPETSSLQMPPKHVLTGWFCSCLLLMSMANILKLLQGCNVLSPRLRSHSLFESCTKSPLKSSNESVSCGKSILTLGASLRLV